MAPPTIRRSGHSRKAQYSAFTGYLVAALGVVIGAGFLIFAILRPDSASTLRGKATDVVEPVGRISGSARSDTVEFFDVLSGYFTSGARQARLNREVEEAHVKLAEADATATENRHLKQLLDLRETDVKPVAYGRLIGSTSTSTRRIAYLSVGSRDGVKPGMPVRSPFGLVGRVLETGDTSSRVLLITDAASIVPVRRTKDDVVAYAEGRADGTLRLRLINLGINPLRKGDVMVTSGAGGIYRPNIAVGIVEEANRDGAIARPLSDPATTVYVAIEPIWVPEAVSVLSAKPAEPKK